MADDAVTSVWAELNHSLEELENVRKQHRTESALVIDDIETQIKEAGSAYLTVSQNVREWIDEAEQKLSIYSLTSMKSPTQLKVLLKSLNDGLATLNVAQQQLDKNLMDFNPFAANLQTSIARFDHEFKEKEQSFQSKLNIMRAANAKGAFDKVEKILVPKVLDQIDFYEINFRKVLSKKTQQIYQNVESIKAKLRGEIQNIGNLKAKVEPVISAINMIYPIHQANVDRLVKELIESCKNYSKTNLN